MSCINPYKTQKIYSPPVLTFPFCYLFYFVKLKIFVEPSRFSFLKIINKHSAKLNVLIAPPGFEPGSRGPKPRILDRWTMGLLVRTRFGYFIRISVRIFIKKEQ